jgi:lipoprotein LprG
VTAQLPGQLVADLLTSQDPEQDVAARFSVATESGELRRAELSGPFFAAEEDATFTLELSDFGADVDITAPRVG